jgi:hypothetical protein
MDSIEADYAFDHRQCRDAESLSAEQRTDELAAILAIGVQRLLSLRTTPAIAIPSPDQIPADSVPNCLEVSCDSRLHGRVVNTPRERERTKP